ncbi:MAG: DUF2256 domain-containing protein [Pseudomonadota bacterium]
MSKTHLPEKICAKCGLPLRWRKKWAKVWYDVRYCSERCRRNKRCSTIDVPAQGET